MRHVDKSTIVIIISACFNDLIKRVGNWKRFNPYTLKAHDSNV